MRYDTPVYFQTIKSGEYDASTGNYGEDIVTEEKRYASVTDTGIETLNIIYGEIKQGVKTVRLQNYYEKPFDRVRIGKKVYRVDRARPLRLKYTLIVSEVQ
jgi:hypothetical protein